jgi:hypothetical protein
MGAAGYGAASGLMVGGTIYSALAQDAAGVYNQAMAEYDAKQLDDLAVDAINRGEGDAQRVGLEGKRVLGEQRAAIAGQGIDVGVGTATDIQTQTLEMTARDMRQVRLNAMEEARGIRTQAASTRANGRMGARTATGQAAGTLLTGGAQAISMAAQGVESYTANGGAPWTVSDGKGNKVPWNKKTGGRA